MAADDYILSITQGAAPPLPSGTSDELAALALRLKTEADRHWHIDPQVSLRCADAIVAIGVATGHVPTTALGTMARGDALKLLKQLEDAWGTLDDAGDLYRSADDDVGWARTRIGRVAIAVQLGRVDEAMRDADTAREILASHRVYDRLVILEINVGAAWNYLGDYHRGRLYFEAALAQAEALGADGTRFLGMIYTNLGYTEQGLGNLRRARKLYEAAHRTLVALGEHIGAAAALHNIATVAQAQGHFRQALALYYQALAPIMRAQPLISRKMRLDMGECYLLLNRAEDALSLAQSVLADNTTGDDEYDRALTFMQIASAEALLGRQHAALERLASAQSIFMALGAESWLAEVRLRRVRLCIGLDSGSPDLLEELDALTRYFHTSGEEIQAARAQLLKGRVALYGGRLHDVGEIAAAVLKTVHRHDLQLLRYDVHTLVGAASERAGRSDRALRHYHAAATAMERVQRALTLTLRAGFLENRQDAVRALLRLYLMRGAAAQALAALERAKSQVWLGYLRDGGRLLPPDLSNDADARAMTAEIAELREAQYWYYRVAHDPAFREAQHAAVSPEEARHEAAWRERRLRELAEILETRYAAAVATVTPVDVATMQAHLPQDTCLIAYYEDGAQFWAFTLTRHAVASHRLPESPAKIAALQEKLLQNIGRALRAGASAPDIALLSQHARGIAAQLHSALLAPLLEELTTFDHLVIVPYGSLHSLPFHLLHDGTTYLIEQRKVSILPTASLLVRAPVRRSPGALALAHSWDGRLPYTTSEAQTVVHRLGGQIAGEDAARRAVLECQPSQVLHIAAHGQYRIDQPDLSYVHLADGALYTNELMEYDLSYELVTISACETARSHVAPGDEVIGIGRGLLFAGARALVASLWRVNDSLTGELMDAFYRFLAGGSSKTAALRDAQRWMLREYPGLHPAFWGAFELIGNPDPLSRFLTDMEPGT